MEFQVLDMAVSYNLLLGRPWIHVVKAVLSLLHQMVKFEWDRQEIAVHGDENFCAYNDTSIPFIEAKDDKGPWVYQTFETVSIEKNLEGECIPSPKLASASVMVANKILKNGFVPDKGLGLSLQGIVHLVCLHLNLGTFGLGLKPTWEEVKRAKSLKKKAWSLPKHVLRLSMSFVKQGVVKHPMSAIPKPVVDFDEKLIKRFRSLFNEVNMVEIGEANVVPVSKKDGKTRVYVDYHDLNKASPKDNFLLPNIHILIDNCAKHEIEYFVDCYAGYHQILMDEEDTKKTAFITPRGTYCYRVMPFGLKNAGETYMRAMTTIFHDMMYKEIEVYVDDVIIKSRKQSDHVVDLRKFFQRLRKYNLKLNPAKCAFGAPSGKLLGFIVNGRGIELDPSKIKAI
ncbi:uncharacterized protein [Nicotiana sylvestris]|uniref:uncharacterized protein n=1 Tax=Nicotiana sylvestris TaxID=4096 RepID=UPI00388CB117